MKKQTRFFYLCLVALAGLGLRLGNATVTQPVNAAPSKALAAPATLAANEGCSAGIGNVRIQRAPGGNNFTVSWEAPSPCLNGFEVSLTVIKLSGAERTDRKKINGRILSANFSFAGDGDLNPIKKARATIKGIGVLAAKATLTKNLGIGADVGSSSQGLGSSGSPTPTPIPPGVGSNKSPTPTPVSTFRLSGQIRNQQDGNPLLGVKLTFDLVGEGSLKRAPAPVETDNQGRWQQDGFPVGAKVRITASKRFFVIEPASRVVSEGGEVPFAGRPSDVGNPAPTPTPQPSFSATGRAVVNGLSRGTQTGLAGATISFAIQNANGINKPNLPGPVTTQSDGKWNQSGFTVGVTYKAAISKSGVTFGLSTALFSGNKPGQVVNDVGFIGTVK